ncbi:MAG: hypothetical protein A4E53_01807 [Pelotomaculum sp. PtaB.Bin104]|nr:MAG: hypothetical protein A4E53_01807 [Pelotomaculum sp. PtaB.Bin104]
MKEKFCIDILKCIKSGVEDIEAKLDDPKTGLAEIKQEIKDIEKRLDKMDDKKDDKKDENIMWVLKGKKKRFTVPCVGNVTIITEFQYVFVGRLVPDKDDCCDHDGRKELDDFITLTLTAPLLAVSGNGEAILEQPYYVEGDTVLINIDQINTIGPANPPFTAMSLTIS